MVNTEPQTRHSAREMLMAMTKASQGDVRMAFYKPDTLGLMIATVEAARLMPSLSPDLELHIREQTLDINVCMHLYQRMAEGDEPGRCMFCKARLVMSNPQPADKTPSGIVVLRAPEPVMRANIGKFAALGTAVCQDCVESRDVQEEAVKFWQDVIGDEGLLVSVDGIAMPSCMVH